MYKFLIRRFLIIIPTLLGVTLATFLIAHFIPGEPLAAILGQRALDNEEIVEHYRAKWGLDKSLPEQFFIYLGNLMKGDLGVSIRMQRPVVDDLSEFFPATIELAIGALTLSIVGGVLLGVLAAIRRDTALDQAVRVIALIGSSMPVFWMALIFLQIFYAKLAWVPGPGRLDGIFTPPPKVTGLYVIDGLLDGDWELTKNAITHLALPSLVLGWYQMGLIARITRAAMLDALAADYVRTAHSKGLAEHVVIFRHVFRNAMLPTLTVIGLAVAGLMAGAVQTETIFAWPGIGRYAVQSSENLDFPAIMGVTLLISILFIGSNFVVDLLYGLLDPRVRASE
ncbi:MAG: ABC transporter permease [Anaerolineales bacterium]|nr:ABC transporter permease [Anaerolineales bacterium]